MMRLNKPPGSVARRSILATLLLVLACAPAVFSQRQGAGKTDVYVYVTFDDETPAARDYRVQLSSGSGIRIEEQFTNDRGQAIFNGLSSGEYRVLVRGTDIDEAEMTFTILPNASAVSSQNEHIQVRRTKKAGAQALSLDGVVSSAALNIPDKARKEFEKGLTALDNHDFPAARQRFEKAVELYPQYCGALLDLGVIAMQDGHADDGKHYFERAVQADPSNPAAYIYLAKVDMREKDYKDAEGLLTKAMAIIPLDPEPLTLLASTQLQSGEFEDAANSARKVHTLQHAQFAIAHFIAAQALLKLSQPQPQQAADELRLYLQEAPNGPNAASAKAALTKLGNSK